MSKAEVDRYLAALDEPKRSTFLGHAAQGSKADVAAVLQIVESYWDEGERNKR